MSIVNAFKLLGLASLFALNTTKFCSGMDSHPMDVVSRGYSSGSDFSSMSISSEDSCEIDSILECTKTLRIKFSHYTVITNTTQSLKFGETESTKYSLLNGCTCDQGWLIFDIIQDLARAKDIILDISPEQQSRDICTALQELQTIIKLHQTELVSVINQFDYTANLRLLWLLAHKFAELANNKSEFLALTSLLISEKNYHHKRSDWFLCAQKGLCNLDVAFKHGLKEILNELVRLPNSSNFYLLLGLNNSQASENKIPPVKRIN